jgi:hypothetical protein
MTVLFSILEILVIYLQTQSFKQKCYFFKLQRRSGQRGVGKFPLAFSVAKFFAKQWASVNIRGQNIWQCLTEKGQKEQKL